MNVRKLCIILVALALALSATGCQLMDKLKAREHLNNGVQAYSGKRYEEAAEEFRSAIELDPELVDAYLYLATSYRAEFVPGIQTPDNLRRGQQAIATFERVVQNEMADNSAQINAIANIADLYRNMNEPDKAKDWYRQLMDLQEDKSQALYGMATIDYKLVDDKTGPDGDNVENLTEEEIAEISQVVDEGIDILKQALEINPRYTDAMEYLNLMYREKAELAQDDEERRQWQKEADLLALEALEMKRQLQREAEEARRRVFQSEESEN